MTAVDVEAAVERIRPYVHRTPVVTSSTLDEISGGSVFLKCENFQRSGAFKARGAFNTLLRLPPERRARGVVAYSSGNHAQAVALAARTLGVAATILMPADAPPTKTAAVRGYGATVVPFDRYADDRAALGQEIAERTGALLIPPFDHPDVIAGQGTAVAELIDEVGALDVIVTPVSGGGLLAGSALAATARLPHVRLVGVEPAVADDTKRSLAAGRRLSGPVPRTIADGLAVDTPGELTFPLLQRLVEDIVLVSEEQIVEAMRWSFERTKLVLEPSAAVTVAALLNDLVPGAGRRIGVVLSGGNVGADRFADLLRGGGG